MNSFKILGAITCGFEPGEFRRPDEFPIGTDFSRLVDLGVIRPTAGLMLEAGDPKNAAMLDQIEDLQYENASLAKKAEAAAAAAKEESAAREAEIADLKARLDSVTMHAVTDVEDLRKLLAAREAEIADLKASAEKKDEKAPDPSANGQPAKDEKKKK